MHKAIRSLTHTLTLTHTHAALFRLVRSTEPSGFAALFLMAKCFYSSEHTRHFMGMQRLLLCASTTPNPLQAQAFCHLPPNDIAT